MNDSLRAVILLMMVVVTMAGAEVDDGHRQHGAMEQYLYETPDGGRTTEMERDDDLDLDDSFTSKLNDAVDVLGERVKLDENGLQMDVDNTSSVEYEDEEKVTTSTTTTTTTTEKPLHPLRALRNYIEDPYVRRPIAIVVDTEASSLSMATETLNAMEDSDGALNVSDLVLIAYDSDAIKWMSHHKAANPLQTERESKSFMKALNGLTPSQTGGRSLQALVKASRLLPYDSAIFLFSNRHSDAGRTDDEESGLVRQLLAKRIKLYVVCSENTEVCRGSVARATGGNRVHLRVPEQRHRPVLHREVRALEVYYDSSDEVEDIDDIFDKQDSIVIRRGLTDVQTLELPIDSGISILTVSMTGNPEKATLTTSSGFKINLLDQKEVEGFSNTSEILSLSPTAAIRLVLIFDEIERNNDDNNNNTKITPGLWQLQVKGGNATSYSVQVDAESNLHVSGKVITQYVGPRAGKKNIRISVGGPFGSIKEANLVNEHGKILGKLHNYKYHATMSYSNDATDIETIRAQESGVSSSVIPLPVDMPKDQTFHVEIVGWNDRDENVIRMSQELQIPPDDTGNIVETLSKIMDGTGNEEGIGRGYDNIESDRGVVYNVTKESQQTTLIDGKPMTTLQIGSASRLHGAPGLQMQVHFEVTNNRENQVFYRFHAKDEQYYLRSMIPQTQWISGGQTVNVILTVGITSTAENNVRDTITFTATGLDQTTINAYVYVSTDGRIESDRTRPYLTYSYVGDCMGYISSGCSSKSWGLDLTAKDSDSGLMRITTTPVGIIYSPGFYAGTKEEVYAKYRASCCNSKVNIAAVDLNGNTYSYDLDVANYLTPATISAIVLGVVLFIALIIILILVIRWIVRRKRDSRDLPSYQTQRAS